MNKHIQIQVLDQAIKSINNYIKNSDLSQETNVDLVFGDDMEQSVIDAVEEIGNNFDSYKVIQNNEVVTAEQLEEIASDFAAELENIKSK